MRLNKSAPTPPPPAPVSLPPQALQPSCSVLSIWRPRLARIQESSRAGCSSTRNRILRLRPETVRRGIFVEIGSNNFSSSAEAAYFDNVAPAELDSFTSMVLKKFQDYGLRRLSRLSIHLRSTKAYELDAFENAN
jgi:hypothetical protein